MRLRSLLYVPAHQERFIAKAHERGADAIILDLEGSVLPTQKDAARAGLTKAVASVGRDGAKVFVRVNSEPEVPTRDAEAALAAGAYGLVLPKARDSKAIVHLAAHLTPIERQARREEMPFIALIEDAGAVLDARSIARAPRVMALLVGSEDLALTMGAEPSPEVLRYPKLLVHYAAKAEGKLSLGLLRSIADYADLDAVKDAAGEAKSFGFDGATCVHPSVVRVLNAAFLPSAAALEWARRIVAAAEAAEARGEGVFVLEGKMVDAPVVARARRILTASTPPGSGEDASRT